MLLQELDRQIWLPLSSVPGQQEATWWQVRQTALQLAGNLVRVGGRAGVETAVTAVSLLQERISQFSGQERGKELGLSLVKDKFGYPLPSPDREPAPSSVLRGGVQAKKELFMRPVSSPDQGDLPPPPPPPRSR